MARLDCVATVVDDGVAGNARPVRFRTRDGVSLAGAVVGSGLVGALLIHEYPGGSCGWLPYACHLSRHAVARADRYVPVADMRAVARRVRSRTRRVIVLPQVAGHGWAMLFGTTREWSGLATTVAAFIRRHAAVAGP